MLGCVGVMRLLVAAGARRSGVAGEDQMMRYLVDLDRQGILVYGAQVGRRGAERLPFTGVTPCQGTMTVA